MPFFYLLFYKSTRKNIYVEDNNIFREVGLWRNMIYIGT